MDTKSLEKLLQEGLQASHVEVTQDGSHCHLLIVSEQFAGLRAVKQQQTVYALINDAIADGSLHAVNMTLYTPEQWAQVSQ